MSAIDNKNNNYRGFLRFAAVSFLVIMVLELTLFNYDYWITRDYSSYEITPYAWDNDVTFVDENTWYFENDGSRLYFQNIDLEIKNIRLEFEDLTDFNSSDTWRNYKTSNYQLLDKVSMVITVDDYANCNGLEMPERTVVSSIDSTQYITMHLAGTTSNMSIQFTDASGRTLHLKHCIVNASVPMNVRIDRIALLLIILLVLYSLRRKSPLYDIKLNLGSRRQRIVVVLSALLVVIVGAWLLQSNTLLVKNLIWFSPEYGSRYNLLTEALLNGHFYIDKEVDPVMYTLTNPYDPAALENAGLNWSDLAYYNGKYYIYFGIVPVLLFYLPAKVLLGIDINAFHCMAVLLPLFVAGTFLLIYELVRQYRRGSEQIPLVVYLMLCILFVNGSFAFFGLASPDMYYLPIFMAMVLSVWGLWFWLTALQTKDNDEPGFRLGNCKSLSAWRLAAGSACIALLAGSRPQFLLMGFLAVPIFYDAVFKKRLMFSRRTIRTTLCFLLPVIVFALFMFWYNYARFGNILDFGANYNQTSNDMTSRGFELGRVFQGIYYYLLQPSAWEECFPYIHSAIHDTQYTGTNIFEDTYGGILFLQPALFILFLIPCLRKNLKEHRMYLFVLIAVISGIVIAVVDSVMAAVLARYYLDFAIFLMLAAVVVFLEINTSRADTALCQVVNRLLVPAVCFATLLSVLLVYDVIKDGAGYWYTNPIRFYNLKTLIEFWY